MTQDAFTKIMESCNAFAALGDQVASFASKTSDTDEHFYVCDKRVHQVKDMKEIDQSYHGCTDRSRISKTCIDYR